MNIKHWEISSLDKDEAKRIAREYDIPAFLAMLLQIRGFRDEEQIADMLELDYELSDPFLIKDMDKAVERIRRAVDGFEMIAVYGDYDADGLTATAILYMYLQSQGANVMYYIPQREGEGYGMNPGAVKCLAEQGVTLIITVDNGISSVHEVEAAKALGVDVVITDHHRPQEIIPDACAVVDAYQKDDTSPFKDFSGAGMVLKLLTALEDGDSYSVLTEYSDLAALGTIADVVPLLGENRTIVKIGLQMIADGGRPGIDALLSLCLPENKSLSSVALSFTIIPKINATGRMGAPERAVKLLIGEDPEEMESLAREICGDNEERRGVEARIAGEAIALIEGDEKLRNSRVLIVSGNNWHHGVIGIVASRVTERYGKPCFILSESEEGVKGSGRSVERFSLFEAVSYCGDLLEKFGGHPMAAGINLKAENIEAFREKINLYAKENNPVMPAPVLKLDCKLNPAALTPQLPEDMKLLGPFGAENPAPLFGLFEMELSDITPVGNGSHLRLSFKKEGAVVNCMRFGVRQEEFPYEVGDKLDLAVSLDSREYRGEAQLTVNIRDIKLSSLDTETAIKSMRAYEAYKRREELNAEESELIVPTRDDMAALYRLLVKRNGAGFSLISLLGRMDPERFNPGKLHVCFEILEERNLVIWEKQEEKLIANIVKTDAKVDIFASPVFKILSELKKI